MSIIHQIAEEKILKAMDEGVFNHLGNMGKPLKFKHHPHVPEETRLANKILEDNNYKPIWIEQSQDINQAIKKMREDFQKIWKRAKTISHKELAVRSLNDEVGRINRKFYLYNLQVPLMSLQRPPLNLENERDCFICSQLSETKGV